MKRLSELLDYLQPAPYIVSSEFYDDSYKTPVLTAGKTFILGYTDDTEGIYSAAENPIILFDDFTTASKWVDFDFKVKSSACKILIGKRDADLRYIYHAMQSIQFDSSEHKRYWIKDYSQITIPYPDKQKRDRIVRTLDGILDQIELAQSKIRLCEEQVKSLFNEMFPEGRYPTRSLISCCAEKDDVKCGPFGTQLSHDEYQTAGIPLYEIAQISSRFAKMPVNFLTNEKAIRLSQYSLIPGDIAMSRKGKVGDCVVVPSHFEKGIIHSDVVRIRTSPLVILPEFLACQFINSQRLQASVNQVSSGAIMPGINVTKLKNVDVECPPLCLQTTFVDRLHQIDKLRFNYQQQIDVLQELMDKKTEDYFGGNI